MNPPYTDEQAKASLCKCPQCAQHLVLLDELLDQADGWVRCSNCEQVFLGLACLLDMPSVRDDQVFRQSIRKTERPQPIETHQQPISIDEFLYQKTIQNQTQAVSSGAYGERNQGHLGASALEQSREKAPTHGRKRGLGSVRWVALFLVMVLPLGFTYRFRNELAALHEGLKEPLVKMCEILNCQIEWPRDLSALSIESSSLEKEELSDKEVKSNATGSLKRYRYHLSLRIRNSFSYALALPSVKLVFLDEKDQVIDQRTLELTLMQGPPVIKPGGLNQFLVPIPMEDLPALVPNGYRIELE